MLDAVETDAGALGDLFFMKYRLEHYDVPPEFADLRAIGCRVFDDDEGHRVAQIWVVERRCSSFFFPRSETQKMAEAAGIFRLALRRAGRLDWSCRKRRNGVCFMAASAGQEKDLATYLPKHKIAEPRAVGVDTSPASCEFSRRTPG